MSSFFQDGTHLILLRFNLATGSPIGSPQYLLSQTEEISLFQSLPDLGEKLMLPYYNGSGKVNYRLYDKATGLLSTQEGTIKFEDFWNPNILVMTFIGQKRNNPVFVWEEIEFYWTHQTRAMAFTTDGPLDLVEVQLDDLEIYPNPAITEIHLNSPLDYLNYQVYAMSGQLIAHGSIIDQRIDVSSSYTSH